jgi:hypothetical protein
MSLLFFDEPVYNRVIEEKLPHRSGGMPRDWGRGHFAGD